MAQQTHYDILQVARTADTETIKRAYRERIRRFHPDQFAAERHRLQQAGDHAGVQKLDRKIERSKQMTQQINAAYDVLTDSIQRKAYDRQIAEETNKAVNQQIRRQRAQHPEYVRRTVKTRPHNNPNRPKQNVEEKIPRVAIGAFVVIMIVTFGWLSSVFGRATLGGTRPQSTAIGYTAIDLQQTQDAINATRAAREENAQRPTATPRSVEASLRSANVFYEAGQYSYAIELYDRLIAEDGGTATVYTRRGMAYSALYQQGESAAFEQALADYAEALRLDSQWLMAYRERGMLYYTRWLQTNDAQYGQSALDDLAQYETLVTELSPAVAQAIGNLRAGLE